MSTASVQPPAPPKRALRGAEDDRLVTGEGVLIDVPATSVGSRVISGIIDALVLITALIAVFVLLAALADGLSQAQGDILSLLGSVGVLLGIPVTVETLSRGRSVGKWAMKLRVVRDDGGPITFRHAFVRGLVGFIELWMLSGVPAIISAMVTKRGKRLGDLAAGTYVVREETAMRLVPGPMMPPALIPWASTADMSGLPDGLALQIKQYLTRSSTLSPAARAQMGQALLAQVLPRVAPPPPRNAPMEAILAAVLAERRLRDQQRLGREAALRMRVLPDPGSLP